MINKIKNKKVTIITFAIILVLVATMLVGGTTYSKYKSTLKGYGEFPIANWSFLVNGQTSTLTNISLSRTYAPSTIKEGKLAPGVSGSFTIVIDATGSDVGVDYKVEFENEKNIPSKFSFAWGEDISYTLEGLEKFLTGTIKADDTNKVRTYKIDWAWNYELYSGEEQAKQDILDTNAGINFDEMSFDVIVTGTQVKPQKV